MATSTAKNYEFDLSGGDSLIASQLQKIVTDTDLIETNELLALSKQLIRERSAEAMHNTKLSKRSQIYERAQERLRNKEREYDSARRRTRAARTKLMDRSSKSAKARERAANCENRISQIKLRKERMAVIFEGDAYEKRALMIRFVSDLINTDRPIKYSHRADSLQILEWQTNDIFIKDGFGGLLDYNFGKFNVLVELHHRNGTNSVNLYCTPDGSREDREANYRRGYPHPHLNHSRGAACMGNLAPRLIQAMGDKDIASVIQEVTEFLMHYNKENPYVRLEEWIVNRWDNAVCESGGHLRSDCPCPRCTHCGQIFDEEDLSDCGNCHSCCMTSHIHSQDIVGINGTTCIDRREHNARVQAVRPLASTAAENQPRQEQPE